MSSASSVFLPSPNAEKVKNVLWLETWYFNLSSWTVTKMYFGATWNSPRILLKYYNFKLQFQFHRKNLIEYKLTCIQIPLSPPTCNYRLEFHCSMNIFNQDPIVLVLRCGRYVRSSVSHTYDLNASSSCMSPNAQTIELELKISVKMIEYERESSQVGNLAGPYHHQEEQFRKMREQFFNEKYELNDLCYILQIPEVKDLFTGNQTDAFAQQKSYYIARIADFSEEIVGYMKSKEAGNPNPVIDLERTLNYILKGERKQINAQNLFIVYYEGYRMGLNFLVDLARDAILDRLDNILIDALVAADYAGDYILFEKAAERFFNRNRKLTSEEMRLLLSAANQGRFMVRSLWRHMKRMASERHVQTVEISQSEPQPSTSKGFV